MAMEARLLHTSILQKSSSNISSDKNHEPVSTLSAFRPSQGLFYSLSLPLSRVRVCLGSETTGRGTLLSIYGNAELLVHKVVLGIRWVCRCCLACRELHLLPLKYRLRDGLCG